MAHYLISIIEQLWCLYWITYLETAQTTLVWSLPLENITCGLWILEALPPSMTFHPHWQVTLSFSVSSDTNFFYHPSIYPNSLVASCFPTKWLPTHKQQLFADLSGLLGSNSPSSILVKHSPPCLHLLATFYIGCNLTQPVFPESFYYFGFCSSITPIYCVSMLTFHKGTTHSQSADTADVNSDDNVAVVLESFCSSCPPTIVDEQSKVKVIVKVTIWQKNQELCSLSGADTVNSDQCANGFHKLVMKPCHCSSNNLLKYRRVWCAYLFGILKQRKLFTIMEI